MFDVIIDCEHIGVGIYRMKPDGRTLEYQQGYIRDCAGAQARRNGQMHTPADSPFFPFSFERVHRDRRDIAVRIAATASLAYEKMPLDDANGLLFTIASGDIDKNVGRHEVYSTRAFILRQCEALRWLREKPNAALCSGGFDVRFLVESTENRRLFQFPARPSIRTSAFTALLFAPLA
jgi:hypothetical protein